MAATIHLSSRPHNYWHSYRSLSLAIITREDAQSARGSPGNQTTTTIRPIKPFLLHGFHSAEQFQVASKGGIVKAERDPMINLSIPRKQLKTF